MYLVIDIGGTYTKYGYYDVDGTCQYSHKYPTVKSNIEEFYLKIKKLIQPQIQGIAISMPGLLDSQSGYVEAITLLPFLAQHNIKEELMNLTQLPVSVENDAKCATLGEMWKGSLKDAQNALMMVLGSGIGGTIILDGHILSSPRHKAGEIGSILVPTDKFYNSMTNFGHHNNANALIQKISQVLNCDQNGEYIFKHILDNQETKDIFEQYCREIAFTIYNLDYILDLDVVCIGGGISEQDLLISTIQQQFSLLRNQYKEDNHEPIIKSCTYKNEANLLGALAHHINQKK